MFLTAVSAKPSNAAASVNSPTANVTDPIVACFNRMLVPHLSAGTGIGAMAGGAVASGGVTSAVGAAGFGAGGDSASISAAVSASGMPSKSDGRYFIWNAPITLRVASSSSPLSGIA